MIHLSAQDTSSDQSVKPEMLGQNLLRRGLINPVQLDRALAHATQIDARLGEVLRADGLVSENQLSQSLAQQKKLDYLSIEHANIDPSLARHFGLHRCLRHKILPIRRVGSKVLVATSEPAWAIENRALLETSLNGMIELCFANESALIARMCDTHGAELAELSEKMRPKDRSCRALFNASTKLWTIVVMLSCLGLALVLPTVMFSVFTLISLFWIWAYAVLAASAVFAHWRRPAAALRCRNGPNNWPRISIIVALYKEKAVIGQLIDRLKNVDYPTAKLDIVFVVEADDRSTSLALKRCQLPDHFSVLSVPAGQIQTKPRALNYALPFCRGELVGIYDAEDVPERDQLCQVARHFTNAEKNLACVQGRLDYHNAHQNILTRCFTIEYASWFRVLLPGLETLGLTLPLGGTSLFIRRDVIEKLGGWDAHNVTEDADLGLQLARSGYHTEMLNSTTYEEATSHPWRWIRQRSRWIKGYLITYCVHMARPRRLLADLGWRRFLGIQVLFLGSVLNALSVPFIWSLWLIAFDLPHPWTGVPITSWLLWSLPITGVISCVIAGAGLRIPAHRGLVWWLPLLFLYHATSFIAAVKAIIELLALPFYWDKTPHGFAPIKAQVQSS